MLDSGAEVVLVLMRMSSFSEKHTLSGFVEPSLEVEH